MEDFDFSSVVWEEDPTLNDTRELTIGMTIRDLQWLVPQLRDATERVFDGSAYRALSRLADELERVI